MDSSDSDDSFAWTNASSDSSDKSSLKINMKDKRRSEDELVDSTENEKERKKSKKTKKRKASSDESSAEIPIKKRIKTEPDSDSQEKKIKTRKNRDNSSDKSLDEDDYLNLRVKKEYESYEDINPKKEKKKKRLTEAEISELEINASVDNVEELNENGSLHYENDHIESKLKQKTEKKKKRSKVTEISKIEIDECVSNSANVNGNGNLEDDYNIEEKITVEDTIITKPQGIHVEVGVEDRVKSKKKKKKDKKQLNYDDENNSHSDSVNISSIVNDITEIEHTDNEIMENGSPEILGQQFKHQEQNKSKSSNSRRVSERITFEDDTSDMDISMQNDSNLEKNVETKKSKHIERYIENNQNLQTIRQKIEKTTVISDDDEVWLFRCPREIDISQLKGASLSDDSKNKIKVGGKNYDVILEEDNLQLPIFTYNFKDKMPVIKNIKLCGSINLKRRLPKPQLPDSEITGNNQTDFIPLPETKCRHPLFGVNYKKSIKIPAEVAERLKAHNTAEPDEEVKKKKKKHKKEKRQLNLVEESEEVPVKLEEEPVKKKKKKRKHSQIEDSPPVKAKRIKHDPNCAETWESEKAIEETLFNF